MYVRFMKRGAVLSAGVVLAALLAVGCGSAKTGAGKAASSAGGLSFVPRTAVGYVTVDTDFSDASWDRARKLGSKFPQYAAERDKLMAQLDKGGTNKLTYNADVKPWLGKDAGMALVLTTTAKTKGHVIAWVASKDDGKAAAALKKGGVTSAATYKGTKTYAGKGNKSYFAINSGYVLLGDDEATLKLALDTKKSGPSISADKTAIDAAKHVDNGAVIALVVGRDGVKSALDAIGKSSSSPTITNALKQVKVNDFNGLALGVSPKDHGVAVDGWVGNGGKTKLPALATPTLLTNLPATTALAISGQNLGGGLDKLINALGKSDPKVSAQITQGEAALGLDNGALGKAFGGQFSISAGAGTGTAPAVALVVENQGSDTKNTLDKLIGVSQLAGATPAAMTVKGGTGKKVTFGSITIAEGTLKDVSIVTNAPDWLNTWGTGATLGNSDSYKRVIGEAGMPDKVGAFVYVDPQSTAALGQSLAKTSIGSSLTSKLGSAVGGATGSTAATGSAMGGTAATGGAMGTDMGAMGGGKPTPAAQAAMLKQTLANFGPIVFWTARDGQNLEFHAFNEIMDAPTK